MPHEIEQPAANTPTLPWAEPTAADRQRAEARAMRDALPGVAIRHIDVPFDVVFWLVLKVFIAQAILAAIVALLWYLFTR